MTIKEFCSNVYTDVYNSTFDNLAEAKLKRIRKRNPKATIEDFNDDAVDELEKAAQKEAIKNAIIDGIKTFPGENVAEIWRAIYEFHVHRKSGIDNADVIHKVISADQSWKKSSGHAFEEMIKLLGTAALQDYNIEIILQKDLKTLLNAKEISNEPRDISWLKEQVKGNVFDLYAITRNEEGETYCFGCIQCKTSIRDRVTRDREPSKRAMESYFWSAAIVLDGSWLEMPKFIDMVNGGGNEFKENGWHGMYIFTNEDLSGRIYKTNIDLDLFVEHAKQAVTQWLNQRQWLDSKWIAK